MKTASYLCVGAVALTALCAPAQAVPVIFCKDGPGINLVTQGCISGEARGYPGGGDGIYSNAGGGDPESAVETAILAATGSAVDISLYGKSDSNASLFTFSGSLNSLQSGTWDVVNNSVLIKYITIKAANSFSVYELAGGGANNGPFTTLAMLNNGGQQPTVSHISFWTVSAQAVPEPASWAMLIAGFAAVGGMLRRRTPGQAHLTA